MGHGKTPENKAILIDLITQLAKYFDNLRDDLCEPYGLTPVQAVIIFTIARHPEECKVTDICKRLRKSTNTISPLIQRLVAKGFLAKEQSGADMRVTNIVLTDKTREILNNITIDIEDYSTPMFDYLSDDEFDAILLNLEKLLEAIKR